MLINSIVHTKKSQVSNRIETFCRMYDKHHNFIYIYVANPEWNANIQYKLNSYYFRCTNVTHLCCFLKIYRSTVHKTKNSDYFTEKKNFVVGQWLVWMKQVENWFFFILQRPYVVFVWAFWIINSLDWNNINVIFTQCKTRNIRAEKSEGFWNKFDNNHTSEEITGVYRLFIRTG